MNVFYYYRKAVIHPSLFILFFCILYPLFDNYKNEWNITKSAIIISLVTSVIYCLIMCVLSLTIFLNKFQKLNKKLFWNILTWFLLPFGYIVIFLIHDINNRINYNFGFGHDFIYLLIMTTPFLIGLYTTFIKYRQKITTACTN